MNEKSCSNGGRGLLHSAIILLLLTSPLILLPVHAANSHSASSGQSLTLNVYLDSSGKALITGNAENIGGLDFLNGSQFRLENDSHQLYALTAGLTAKEGDLWMLRFDARGNFVDYRVTFYLPSESSLGEINISQGLGYLLSASNESLVADVQGWDISNPRISIQYRQPLSSSNSQLPPPPGYPGQGTALIVMIIAAALMIAGFGIALFRQKKRRSPMIDSTQKDLSDEAESRDEAGLAGLEKAAPDQSDNSGRPSSGPSSTPVAFMTQTISPPDASSGSEAVPINKDQAAASSSGDSDPHDPSCLSTEQPSDSAQPTALNEYAAIPPSPLSLERAEDGDAAEQSSLEGYSQEKPLAREIVVSSEMEAVVQTLTARERSVIYTLISHGGRMTQAEIRYETGTPKSSLTGILISLERRKLVIKKEWGRTNIIELSDWFLSKKERS